MLAGRGESGDESVGVRGRNTKGLVWASAFTPYTFRGAREQRMWCDKQGILWPLFFPNQQTNTPAFKLQGKPRPFCLCSCGRKYFPESTQCTAGFPLPNQDESKLRHFNRNPSKSLLWYKTQQPGRYKFTFAMEIFENMHIFQLWLESLHQSSLRFVRKYKKFHTPVKFSLKCDFNPGLVALLLQLSVSASLQS